MYIGTENKKFYQYMGVKDNRLIYAPYCVDNAYFSSVYESRKANKVTVKQELGIPTDKVVILYSGKYIDKKRPLELLAALDLIKSNDYYAIFMGEGELRHNMQKFINEKELNDKICLTGFVNQTKVANYYLCTDIYTMTSEENETWGLSTNEAMNFGVPIVISDHVGCSTNLVNQGVNGYVYPLGDIETLSKLLSDLIQDDTKRKSMGASSKEIIKEYSFENVSKNIKSSIAKI